jgi:hypothetical protein
MKNVVPIVVSTADLQKRLDQWVNLPGLTQNTGVLTEGKVHPRPERGTDFVAPRNLVEQKLAGIWQSAFNLDRVGVNDDFFDLGGSSLTAIQMLPKMKEALGIDLSVQAFFETPNIARMAALIDSQHLAGHKDRSHIEGILHYVEQMSNQEVRSLLEGEDRG